MFRVDNFAQDDSSVLRDYIVDQPFAALVVSTPLGPFVNHLPMEFESWVGVKGRLEGHVARANPPWQTETIGSAMAVFCAHQAYVSPV